MKTERAPKTALSGRSISEDSLAVSRAIFAAPYAVLQPDSLDDPDSLGALSVGSQDGEAIDEAIIVDEATSDLKSLTPGWVASSFFMYSTIGDVEVGGGLFVALADDEGRKWCMIDARRVTCVGHFPGLRSAAELEF